MGLVYADLEITNYEDVTLAKRGYLSETEIRSQKLKILVDSGAYMLTLPQHIVTQLGLEKVSQQEAELADGSVKLLDIVGPVKITFENRMSLTSAMVIPTGEPLLGAIPMEDMDVIIHPLRQKLVVNPENPYIAKKKLK
jgi:clan AA aspartic protease